MRKLNTVLSVGMGCVACTMALLTGGCSSSSSSDGGSTSDAGMTMDAGSMNDAGMAMDGGQTTDAGMMMDGGSSDAGNVMFKPSNFDPTMLSMTNLADIEGNAMSVGCDVDTDMGTISCAEQPAMTTGYTAMQVSQPSGQNVEVFAMKSFKLDQGVTMNVSGSKPAIFYVIGDADIEGVINLAASGSTDGPGAFHDMGPGQGKPGDVDMTSGNEIEGAGGASYCGTGGQGAPTSGTPMGGGPGATYGTADLIPIWGGSAGGSQSSSGYGGGAFQLTATGTITIGAQGGINVNGDGGDNHNGIGGGGGSGGSILLEAQRVTINGTLTANGGGGGDTATPGSDGNFNATPAPGGGTSGGSGSGGDMQNGQNGSALLGNFGGGGGGAGRIRINTVDGTATINGTLSPSTHTPCATLGKVKT